LFFVVNFLKCVVTEVLFSIVVFTALTLQGNAATHLKCRGIFSDNVLNKFSSNFKVKEFKNLIDI